MSIAPINLNILPDILGLPKGTSVTISGPGEAAGLSNSTLAGFTGGIFNRFLVISTGLVTDVNGANTSGSQGTDLGPVGSAGDSLTLNFVVPKPKNAASIAFDFTFLSEEFPEFVGTQFNDFLSVKLDGTEIALDTSGNPISVNNNFFNSSLPASGTIFDGQTDPLRITAPLKGTSNTFNLTIQIADSGDGIYDSAAFLNNFEILEPQTIFVDFDGGSINFGTTFFFNNSVILPGSGLSATEQNQIIANANAIYSDFLVEFTTTKPSQGEFSTILVGGTGNNVSKLTNSPQTLLGRAESLDFGNKDRSDNAFVLSGQSAFTQNGTANIGLLSQVLAHEAGHILGLRHVSNSTDLMYPFAQANSTNIGGQTPLAEINPNNNVQPIGGSQDSRKELAKNVGLKSSSEVIVVESLFDSILKLFGFSLNSTAAASTIFDAVIATVNTENEVLQYQELGDIAGDGNIEFITPATDKDIVVFLGKSDANGSFDIFLSPGGITKFDPSTASDADLVETLGVQVGEIESGLELVIADNDGNLTTIGTPDVTLLDVSGTQVTDGDDLLVGTDGNDVIAGLDGNDFIEGDTGNDQLFGNSGNDILEGGNGSDELIGGDGSDVIIGLQGRDILTGGADKDQFVYTSPVDAGDIITDFEVGLDQLVFTELLDSIGFDDIDPIATGFVGFINRGSDTIVTIDPDGTLGNARSRSFVLVENVSADVLNSEENFVF